MDERNRLVVLAALGEPVVTEQDATVDIVIPVVRGPLVARRR